MLFIVLVVELVALVTLVVLFIVIVALVSSQTGRSGCFTSHTGRTGHTGGYSGSSDCPECCTGRSGCPGCFVSCSVCNGRSGCIGHTGMYYYMFSSSHYVFFLPSLDDSVPGLSSTPLCPNSGGVIPSLSATTMTMTPTRGISKSSVDSLTAVLMSLHSLVMYQ